MELVEMFPCMDVLDEELARLLETAYHVAKLSGSIHEEHRSRKFDVAVKDLNDIVTSVDTAAEAAILELIGSRYPTHGIKSEEMSAARAGDEFQWVIDPLDGTINYAADIPFYSTSIAVQKDGETLIGVIYGSALGDCFIAVRSFGAYHNGKQIFASNRKSMQDSVLSFMLTAHYNSEQQADILRRVAALSPQVRGLRLYVSQALELAYIACGRLDGHVCIKSRGYSAAAGVLLLREAGGKVTDLAGVEFSNASRSLVGSNGHLHSVLLDKME